jgi:hypothetical protein
MYVFYHRSASDHLEVRAGPDGELPPQAASLLATHCLAHNQSPLDYVVLVPAKMNQAVVEVTQKLLDAGTFVSDGEPG